MMNHQTKIKRLTDACTILDIMRKLGVGTFYDIKQAFPKDHGAIEAITYLTKRDIIQVSKKPRRQGQWSGRIYSIDVDKVYELSAPICDELDELEMLYKGDDVEEKAS